LPHRVHRGSAALALLLSLAAAACAPPPAHPAPVGSSRYADPASWLCLPGRSDACTVDITATEIHLDGTHSRERFEPAASPKADCFFVYPTVDLSLIPRNHDDFSSLEPMAKTTQAQVARFRESCALYVPLYRQVTIGTYLQRDEWRDRALAVAFADVEAAFVEYMAHANHGRPIILLGHSQGAEMVIRLARRFFDQDAKMRERLLLVMAIGGDVEVLPGQTVGGTFANIPACTGPDQTACVIAYQSYARDEKAIVGLSKPRPGNEMLCVNPADVEHNALSPLAGAYLPVGGRVMSYLTGFDGIDTPFVDLTNFYAAQCVVNDLGYRYLAISELHAPEEKRPVPFAFDRLLMRKTLGLHILDYQLPQRDLLGLVARRVAKLP
jgi:hypothetical protein